MTALTLRWEMRGMRPGRGASFSSPGSRRAKKRCRQSCTVGREIRRVRAITWLITPSAAIRIICARWTTRNGKLRPVAHGSRMIRSSGDNVMASATLMNTEHSPSLIISHVVYRRFFAAGFFAFALWPAVPEAVAFGEGAADAEYFSTIIAAISLERTVA